MYVMAWIVLMHVTLYGMVPMVTLWHGSYHCVTVPINVRHTEA